jgi:hypothetical protein
MNDSNRHEHTCWGWRFRWRQYGWNLDDGRRSISMVKMSKGLQELFVKIHWIRIFWVRRTVIQQALTIWSIPCQLLAKDPAPQFRYLAHPQNPQSTNSSSITECCVANGDAATRIQRWPAGRVWGLCQNCAVCRRSEGFRSVGTFLKVANRRKWLQYNSWETRHLGPWCQKTQGEV